MSKVVDGKHPDETLSSLRGIASHANLKRSNSAKQTMNSGSGGGGISGGGGSNGADSSKQGRPAIEIYRPPSIFFLNF